MSETDKPRPPTLLFGIYILLLSVAILILVTASYIADSEWRKALTVQQSGQPLQAFIMERNVRDDGFPPTRRNFLTYQYNIKPAGGKPLIYNREQAVEPAFYEAHPPGSTVDIRYDLKQLDFATITGVEIPGSSAPLLALLAVGLSLLLYFSLRRPAARPPASKTTQRGFKE